MALELRPACERCSGTLAPESGDAWICAFECTFCAACAVALDRTCPNCTGELVRRPRRGEVVPARRTLRATARTVWTGNTGSGTASYRAYGRSHEIVHGTKPPIAGSSDPMFLGEADRWNPEELQVAALSACHLLWYLHLCADAGVVVTQYADEAESMLHLDREGDGRITHAVLRPRVTLANADDAVLAQSLHANAHARCFLANASAVPVAVEATIVLA